MRAIRFDLPIPTSERQYNDLSTRIKRHYRERIFEAMPAKFHHSVLPEVHVEPWDRVAWRVGPDGFYFRVYLCWSTDEKTDELVRAMLTQHLELSIIPMVYFEDLEIASLDHECSGGYQNPRDCGICNYGEEDEIEDYQTKHANQTIISYTN